MELKTQAMMKQSADRRREQAERQVRLQHEQRLENLEAQLRTSANEVRELRDVVTKMATVLSKGIDVRVETDVKADVNADNLAATIARSVGDAMRPQAPPQSGPHKFRVERDGNGNITAMIRE